MILSARNLYKYYGSFQALNDVSVELEQGEVVGFLGPNGAGKSTTMKIITGSVAPSSGSVTVNGFDLQSQSLQCRRQIGYLPQQAPLYEDMTVAGYLDHVARLKGISRNRRRHEVVESIEAAQLKEVENRHIRKLSGGNRRRVGLAQALLNKPPILILDEPTAGLDPAQVANLRDLIRDLRQSHSILISTHVMAEVETCCSRVIMINRGHCIFNESIDDLMARTREVTRVAVRLLSDDSSAFRAALASTDWASVEEAHDSILIDAPEDKRPDIIALAQEHGGLRECVEQRRSLEDVFRDLLAADTANI